MHLWKILAGALVVVTITTLPNTEAAAQVGRLLGSSDGSTCHFRSRNRITVLSSLPSHSDLGYLQRMSLRRLAEMTRSRDFDTFITQKESCEAHLLSQSEIGRSCTYKATMANAADMPVNEAEEGTRYTVSAIFALTDAEAPSYPRRTGIFERGNDCVVE